MDSTGGDDTLNDNNQTEAETSMRIIKEFKHKPFDELKQALIKSNQTYVNTDKYQQVLDLISRELQQQSNSEATNPSVQQPSTTPAAGSYSNISLSNIKNTSISSMSSNQSTSISSNNILLNTKDGQYGQKTIPLNDIEFPKLFMF